MYRDMRLEIENLIIYHISMYLIILDKNRAGLG